MIPKKILRHETLPLRSSTNRLPAAEYGKAYEKGWRHAQTDGASLDNEPSGPRGWAWEDGYLDAAADRPKWHYATCLADRHDGCVL